MAIGPVADGAALVRVAVPSNSALASLGYTVDGPIVTHQTYWDFVHSDRNGGTAGPPIEVVYLGEIAMVRLLLVEWEQAVLDTIHFNPIAGGVSGTPGTPGTMMFANTKDSRLLLLTTLRPYNFPRVIWQEPTEINRGTKHSRLSLVGTAHKSAAGVLVNQATA